MLSSPDHVVVHVGHRHHDFVLVGIVVVIVVVVVIIVVVIIVVAVDEVDDGRGGEHREGHHVEKIKTVGSTTSSWFLKMHIM